jgi:hypothetical protein
MPAPSGNERGQEIDGKNDDPDACPATADVSCESAHHCIVTATITVPTPDAFASS